MIHATPDPLVDKNEALLFKVLVPLAALAWSGLIIGTLGTALLFIATGALAYLFVQSGFVSFLRGAGAVVSARQYPDLHAHMEACLGTLGMDRGADKRPEMVLIHADGMFNALAARFLRRHYVVLFSDIVDALAADPAALHFYIGHELGHIRRNHLLWDPVLAIVTWLPLVGAGYHRAREYTCDMHGLYCCADRGAAMRGLAALAVGAERWKTINFPAYLEQARATGGFWMSFHEVTGNYPWLVKRVARMEGETTPAPRRSPFAWALGAFVPRLSLLSLAMLLLASSSFGGLELIKDIRIERQIAAQEEAIRTENLDALPHPTTQEELDALPVGAIWVHPETGKLYRKEEQRAQ